MKDDKLAFLNKLKEKYNIIIDFRVMTYELNLYQALDMDYMMIILDTKDKFHLYPNIKDANAGSPLRDNEHIWNTYAKNKIKKIDNVNKLINKL